MLCSAANFSSSARRDMCRRHHFADHTVAPAMRAVVGGRFLFGVAGASCATRLGHQREDVARADDTSALCLSRAAACKWCGARSAAEIPVVTPVVASRWTRELVPNQEPLRGAINGSFQQLAALAAHRHAEISHGAWP